MVREEARIQPRRSPPQKLFPAEPKVMTVACGLKAASGGGGGATIFVLAGPHTFIDATISLLLPLFETQKNSDLHSLESA